MSQKGNDGRDVCYSTGSCVVCVGLWVFLLIIKNFKSPAPYGTIIILIFRGKVQRCSFIIIISKVLK